MTRTGVHRISSSLEKMNTGLYVMLFVMAKLLLNYASNVVNLRVTDEPLTKGFDEVIDEQFTFVLVVLVAPLLETFLAQHLFFKYLSDRLNKWVIVVLSALFFAAFHHYNVGYVFYAFLSGLLLSTSYALRLRANAFVCTALIHSVHNFIGFVYNYWHWQ